MTPEKKRTVKEGVKKHGAWVTALSSVLLVLGEKVSDKVFPETSNKTITRKEVVYIVDSCAKPIKDNIISIDKRLSIVETENSGTKSALSDIFIFQRDLNNYLRENK